MQRLGQKEPRGTNTYTQMQKKMPKIEPENKFEQIVKMFIAMKICRQTLIGVYSKISLEEMFRTRFNF